MGHRPSFDVGLRNDIRRVTRDGLAWIKGIVSISNAVDGLTRDLSFAVIRDIPGAFPNRISKVRDEIVIPDIIAYPRIGCREGRFT